MTATQTKLIMYYEIHRLHLIEGMSVRGISKQLVCDRRTVSKYLSMNETGYFEFIEKQRERNKVLSAYEPFVYSRLEEFNDTSAAQMHDAVIGALPCDLYIGAAAVADFTPRAASANKLKKQPGQDTLVLELVKTRDILAEVAAHAARPRLVVGFAAETDNVAGYARGKLERKGVDLICANRVGIAGGGFESDDNALLVIDRDGERALGPASKTALAGELLDIVAECLSARSAG